MAQQINLYDPAWRKARDWLSAAPLALAFGVLLAVLILAAGVARLQAERSEAMATQAVAKLKRAQDSLARLSKEIAARKPDPRLAAELASGQALLKGREQVTTLLATGGAIGNTSGFSEHLRGLARALPQGLWITGFRIGDPGDELEIRGRMLDAKSLPQYIRRLNSEPAFRGRGFSALTILRPDSDRKAGASAPPTSSSPSSYVEFVLTPAGSASNPARPTEKLP